MRSIFTKAAVAALIGIGSIATVPATASANGIYFEFGAGGPRYYHDYRERFHHRPRGVCRNAVAISKAARMGVRHARVAHRNRNIVRVRGWRHHHRIHITFANNRHCSFIRG